MTIYSGLRTHRWDDAETIARKKRIAGRLLALREALREHLGESTAQPSQTTKNVRIATWNIREFDATSYGARVDEAYFFIAEILSHFDLIAIQEVRRDLRPLNQVKKILGPNWDYLATDVSPGARGNKERMAYVYNTNKVWFRDVAGELTLAGGDRLMLPNSFDLSPADGLQIGLPPGQTLSDPGPQKVTTTTKGTKLKKEVVIDLPAGSTVTLPAGSQLVFEGYTDDVTTQGKLKLGTGATRKFKAAGVRLPTSEMQTEDLQFARTPFFAQFQSEWLKIGLCSVHIYYGDDAEDSLKMLRRKAEIAALTKALADRAKATRKLDPEDYFIVLGDFNIVGKDHGTMQALQSNGFEIPEKIQEIPEGTNVKRDKHYDQIAIWDGRVRGGEPSYSEVQICGAGVFDFFKHVFRADDDDDAGADQAHYEQVMQEEVASGRAKKTYKYKDWRTYQMSDHLPMWIELKTDFSDNYLEMIKDAEQD